MSDEVLLVAGCGVTFLALSGAYVYLRARWLGTPLARRGDGSGGAVPAIEAPGP